MKAHESCILTFDNKAMHRWCIDCDKHKQTAKAKERKILDIEKVKLLFNELGIGYSVCTDGVITTIRLTPSENNVNGAEDFQTDFDFDSKGEFREVGIWKQD